MTAASIWSLAAVASLSPCVAPRAFAQAATIINIPAGTLEAALVSLARQTGVSIGTSGRMPRLRIKAISEPLSVGQALALLLKGSGFQAINVGPNVWRIVKTAAPAPPKIKPPIQLRPTVAFPLPYPSPVIPAEIIVTAAKRTDALETTPIDSTVIDAVAFSRFSSLPTSAAVANLDSGLTLSNIGPGRNRAFLRGVGDSPFNGQTQSTVATLLGDARVTFNAPDPDLRLVDVERVELLKGPQGPLYGTGAIGGVYRIVTAKPRLEQIGASVAIGAEKLSQGSEGVSGSAVFNLPIKQDMLGVRVVAYGALEPGWISNTRSGGKTSNQAQIRGGRLALRWRPAQDWTVDLSGAVQLLHVDDSQYVNSPSSRSRGGILAEPHNNDFINAQLNVAGKLGDVEVFSTTSWTSHEVDSKLDASPAAAFFGRSGALLFEDDRLYHVINQELRASGRSGSLRWMGGGSFLSAMTRVDTKLGPATGALADIGRLNEEAQELALFGDIGLDMSQQWNVDLGARLFSTKISDERQEGVGVAALQSSRHGISPSVAVSFKPGATSYYYLRAAAAFRPAGLGPVGSATASEFASDELTTIELGGRWHGAQRRLSGQAVLYASRWFDIQSDYLLPNGLVATRNSGRGLIYGVEAKTKWRVNESWSLSFGGTLQHSRLEKPAPGLALPSDRQLPIVPTYRANFDLTKSFSLGAWDADVTGHAVFSGSTRLSLDPELDRKIGRYATVDVSANTRRGPWSLGLAIANVLNSDANTFAFGNPFSIRQANQHVPMRPRSIVLRASWDFR